MNKGAIKLITALTAIAMFLIAILLVLAIVGALKNTDGCLYRYNMLGNTQSNIDVITHSAVLQAHGNYAYSKNPIAGQTGGSELDPNGYGQWLNTGLAVVNNQKINLQIIGEVSLCMGYLPENNIQSNSALNNAGQKIPIPRVEDDDTPPLSLLFDARTDNWRNIASLYKNDHVVVSISEDKKQSGPVSYYDVFSNSTQTADCSEKTQYTPNSPICGRYSISSGQYVTGCKLNMQCEKCNCREQCWDPASQNDVGGWVNKEDWIAGCVNNSINKQRLYCEGCSCAASQIKYKGDYTQNQDQYDIYCPCIDAQKSNAPPPYRFDGTYTYPWSKDLSTLNGQDYDCASESLPNAIQQYIIGILTGQPNPNITTSAPPRKFWYSADTATGLSWRMVPGNTDVAKILPDQGSAKTILDQIYLASNSGLLQYSLYQGDYSDTQNNTGGYVLKIKQTKCRRSNGAALDDVIQGRGKIEYMMLPYSVNPNSPGGEGSYTKYRLDVDVDGKATIQVPDETQGYLWMRIYNNPNDYKDSVGQYNVQFLSSQTQGNFNKLILTPILSKITSIVEGASQTIFKNMTCYKAEAGSNLCVNFFNYIRAILSLYIMLYAGMFLLGMVQISQMDLVVRVAKIAVVSGLMNEQTFNFFNTYIFDFVTGFSAQLIANMSGYALFTDAGAAHNPFIFLDAPMSKIFFSKTFFAQLLALLSMGLSGSIYFIIIFIAVSIFVITVIRALAVYIMAFVAISLLIGIAPLFLTFMLFETTKYLFDNWIKFLVRYMLEPVILMAGIIVLAQLFTIYLDYVTGYSVCWKCALPIKIPFPNVGGFDPAFANVELFCINWFAPWGLDHRAGMMGIDMTNIIALIILAYCMHGYTKLSNTMVGRLTNAVLTPSATHMGVSMTASAGQKALSAVGLDQESRARVSNSAKARLERRQEAVQRHNSGQGELKK